jgi:serine phosphatase RsbU (regulator of sigma subunit)
MIKEYLADSFILYLPKDVVAGDFYWMDRKGPWLWFAVCDCTGHGVPGAMVSVVCHNALNRAVNEFGCTMPGKILDKVAELVLDNFSNDQDVKDGMDASLCAWNLETQTIYWSGANNPLWVKGKQGLSIIKPDKQAIGQLDNRIPYTTHKLSLEIGDVLYLFTDGFADQFGGPKEKKLTRSKFQEWLLDLGHLNMDEQRKRLLEQHLAYRGNLSQVDDVCIMGLRPFP